MGSSRSIDQASEVLDTAGEKDSAAERMLREGLLDACREYPVMMRRIQNARRKRGSGVSGGDGSSGEESVAGFDAETLEAQKEEGRLEAAASGASADTAPPR